MTGQPLHGLVELEETALVTLADVHNTTWTRQEHILGAILDSLNAVIYELGMLNAANAKNPQAAARRLKPPVPVARPGVASTQRKPRGTTMGEMKKRARKVVGRG